ncbi:MAG: cytochrome c [Burkholderiales bacterium]|nr:cytochrome c [Burkholderiales bacterium]
MFRPRLLLAAAGLALALSAQAAPPEGARRAQLVELVRQDCGSCHGLTLKGGLGPPLVPQALVERDVTLLESVILNGRPGTAMPPWRPFLTEAEARWIAEQLKKGWPE